MPQCLSVLGHFCLFFRRQQQATVGIMFNGRLCLTFGVLSIRSLFDVTRYLCAQS